LLSEDEVILDEIVSDMLREEGVLYVAISNVQGDILASKAREGETRSVELPILHAESMATTNGPPSIHFHQIDGVGTWHTYMPVEFTPSFGSQTDADFSNALRLLGDTQASAPADDASRRYGNVQLLVS